MLYKNMLLNALFKQLSTNYTTRTLINTVFKKMYHRHGNTVPGRHHSLNLILLLYKELPK